MRLIAFDPGRKTAYAKLDSREPWHIEMGYVDLIGSGRLLRPCPLHIRALCEDVDQAVVEEVGARENQGVSSMFTFGLAVGSVLGALSATTVPIVLVSPTSWKKSARLAGLGRDEAKAAARALAKELWPQQEKLLKVKDNHGPAEAGLIARWYLQAGPGRDVPGPDDTDDREDGETGTREIVEPKPVRTRQPRGPVPANQSAPE
ncbi:hypothetical protein LAZ40_11725 [Cereibacter sphaeroides]|uniref:hypothetical protein n=1 Tax=Cereibacter sphaeroides TaxID=1063 RepID=UPI001F157303|nr:hypothetical protein [Cereibacter sphaeroides]MCE6959688.1 hypothetical protein [Cereibacter sphaeroides]MCE6974451.1 hypothetical protein [Cereibacter sphaeroides]